MRRRGALLALVALASACSTGGPAVNGPAIVPAPTSLATTDEPYSLDRHTRVVAATPAAPVAAHLAGLLRRSTGLPLPASGTGAGITLSLDGPAGLGEEGYRLEVRAGGVRLRAHSPAGLFRGAQTVRQLVPPGSRRIPGTRIEDRPRFSYRGVLLDVARHFFGVEDVKRFIDLVALYKINVLHLHLSDDQGWRLAIDAWPRLTSYGGASEVGGGPGGHYTADDFAEIVRYAGERYLTVVPEIDGPGHTNAALASYPELNCDGKAPPRYTGTRVGFSSLCVRKELTYRFLDEVLAEVTRHSPGPYLHIGGDEARSTSAEDYAAYLRRVHALVRKRGRTAIGWQEVAEAPIAPDTVVQYWKDTDARGPVLLRRAVRGGARVVMSPARRAYLDMKYAADTPGADWAGYVGVRASYSWDPATYVDGVGESDILGVEAALWTERVPTLRQAEYLTLPRLPGIAEIGWSPASGRTWAEYRRRLAAQAPTWEALGLNYHRSPEVPWPR